MKVVVSSPIPEIRTVTVTRVIHRIRHEHAPARERPSRALVPAAVSVPAPSPAVLPRTAQRLGVHENTVKNRVRAARELLGHPPEERVAEVLVALRLARLTRDRNATT